MKFEIDVEIPEGFEPTGEYRALGAGDWYIDPYGGASQAQETNVRRYVILRKKPLAYEDFQDSPYVSVDKDGDVRVKHTFWNADDARDLAVALVAAADHVDRVNAQKERS